jgi:hypothetical protein
MIEKVPIHSHRVRKVPEQFSWLDHRLVRDRYIDHCTHQAAALYLFLVTVADGEGLSYYSDSSLIGLQLIAYVKPLYQVLPLDPEVQAEARRTGPPVDRPVPIGQVFKKIAGVLS